MGSGALPLSSSSWQENDSRIQGGESWVGKALRFYALKEPITPVNKVQSIGLLYLPHVLWSLSFRDFFPSLPSWSSFGIVFRWVFFHIKTDVYVCGSGVEDGNLSLSLRLDLPRPRDPPTSPSHTHTHTYIEYPDSCGLPTSFISHTSTLVQFQWLRVKQMALLYGSLNVTCGQV